MTIIVLVYHTNSCTLQYFYVLFIFFKSVSSFRHHIFLPLFFFLSHGTLILSPVAFNFATFDKNLG